MQWIPSASILDLHGSGEEFGSLVGLYNKGEDRLNMASCREVQEGVLKEIRVTKIDRWSDNPW